MDTYFVSDNHFYHKNIIKYCNRPFSSVEEMNETMIENWNKVVKPRDTVYHLGDLSMASFRNKCGQVDRLMNKLNGQKHLIVGNHDSKDVILHKGWNKVSLLREIKIYKQPIVLCHYSMRVWNRSHYGSWMLYGHSHGSLLQPEGKTMDVGVDCHNYTPISFGEVKEFMDKRQIASF